MCSIINHSAAMRISMYACVYEPRSGSLKQASRILVNNIDCAYNCIKCCEEKSYVKLYVHVRCHKS